MHRRVFMTFLVAGLVALAAGCGGGDSDEPAGEGTPTPRPTVDFSTNLPEDIAASDDIAAILDIDHYTLTEWNSNSVALDLVDSEGDINESLFLDFYGPSSQDNHRGRWTAIHESGGREDFRFQVDLVDVTNTAEGSGGTVRIASGLAGATLTMEIDIAPGRTWTQARYSFRGEVFEMSAADYNPAIDDTQFQDWLQQTEADQVFGHPSGLRLATVIADNQVFGRTPLHVALAAKPLTPSEFINSIVSPDAPGNAHGTFGTTAECITCTACSASGWSQAVGCTDCFVACFSCSLAISREL